MKTMNAYMAKHQNDDETQINLLKNKFTATIDIIKQVLGNDAFMAFDRDNGKVIEKFSGSVYDSIVIPFSFFSSHDLMAYADQIRNAINDLKKMMKSIVKTLMQQQVQRRELLGVLWLFTI